VNTLIYPDANSLARAAAERGAALIREALARQEQATIVLATGLSQVAMLRHLAGAPDIAWHRVWGFHLDEYVGLPIMHPASFRLYLWQRFISRLPSPMAEFHFIDGEAEPEETCARLSAAIAPLEVDVAFVGIGENGHLAFNDPPADFETSRPYIVVSLDEACRRQQLGEGWFDTLDQVPRQAISMSIQQIMASRAIACAVPDLRKAEAVRRCLAGPVSNLAPASILQAHPNCDIFLDPDSASLLKSTG
jgi:glucosamine-6-phosphate deaminase